MEHQKGDQIQEPAYAFPVESMIQAIDKVPFRSDHLDAFDPQIIKEFRSMVLDKRFTNNKKMQSRSILRTSYNDVEFADDKINDIIKKLIQNTAVPDPGERSCSELYKILVDKFSKDFKEAETDHLEAEVSARKLAAWVTKIDEKLKLKAADQGNKSTHSGLFCKDGSSASLEGDDTGNVKLYNVSAAMFQPYWEVPGQVVELKDNEGSQIFVKGLMEGDKKKTLVKKVKNKNNEKEISSWIVELGGRDSEQENSLAESLSEVSGLGSSTSVSKKLRSPSTVDEWKTIADIKMNEAVAWKKRLGLKDQKREPSPSSSEVSASDQDVFLSSQDTQCSSSVRNLRLVNRIGDAISAEHRIRDTKGKSDLSLEISNSSGTTRNSLATSRKARVESKPNTAKRQGRYSLGKVIDPENNKFNIKEELKKATSRHRHGP